MSEEQNINNSTVTTTASNGAQTDSGDWFSNLPPPGSDPFGADDSDEITLIGGRPEPVEQKNRTQQTASDENNIDFDELLSDTVPINNEEQKPQAQQQLPQANRQEQPQQDFKTALDDYGLSVVDGLFNAENFAKQLTESDPNAIALTLKKSLSEMYQRCLQDSLLVARRFADDALKSAAKNQQEQFTAREQAQILKSTLAPYPDLNKVIYKPVVKTVYEKALAKGKTPQEAANLVVAYFRKNIPNAIQEPAQTKQTDGSSINDIWANFR